LMQIDDPYQGCIHPQHGGRDRHLAFAARSLSGRAALFCRDPDGNALEFCEIRGANKLLSGAK